MKGKAWTALIGLVLTSIILASCGPAPSVPTAPATPTNPAPVSSSATATPIKPVAASPSPAAPSGAETPKYGGILIDALAGPHESFDDSQVSGGYAFTVHMTNECLLTGDWSRGPAGTNEHDFWPDFNFSQFEIGNLAESWEIPDSGTIIFHIRKGVHYGLNPQSEASRLVNGRELVAQDVAFSIQRKFSAPGYLYLSRPGWFKSVTATDKYTVVVKADDSRQGTALMFQYITEQLYIYPPEVVQKYGSLLDWSVAVGTGPFMMTDYVSGSSYSFTKNPNYWGTDPVGPGKGNQLPYLDGVKSLLISDKSTRIAAMRTAKVDHLGGPYETLTLEDKQSLVDTNPKLKWKGALKSGTWAIMGRIDKPELPFKDIRVRQALQMAIDLNAIKDQFYLGEAEILNQPLSSLEKNNYIPLEQLPASARELFTYNPQKAKELLAAAGYPNGFKTSVLCSDAFVDILSIVKNYWAKVGVDAAMDVKEDSVFKSTMRARTHKEMIMNQISPTYSYRIVNTDPSNSNNGAMVDDPTINSLVAQIWSFGNITNRAKRDQLLKEYILYFLSQTYIIQLPSPYDYRIWQPWVKNYHGENTVAYGCFPNWTRFTWLDQNLKKQVTGK